MPLSRDELVSDLERLTQPGYRSRLVAKGLARGMIWRDGVLPQGGQQFDSALTSELLDHGFFCLLRALELRTLDRSSALVKRGLLVAAESIESAVRYGEARNADRGFHLLMAAAAFHIGGYGARAFSLFQGDLQQLNLASYERSLVSLMRRDLAALRRETRDWLSDRRNSDAGQVQQLLADTGYSVDDVVAVALSGVFHRACASIEALLRTGVIAIFDAAVSDLHLGKEEAAKVKHVPLWWSFTVAIHLFDDLWGNSLHQVMPEGDDPVEWSSLRRRFIELVTSRRVAEVDLWPSQIEAASRAMNVSDDLVVALPTSAGKTRIAELCILRALADGKRVVYVTPLRALSAQVETTLARTFQPLGFAVTSVYGASGAAVTDLETMRTTPIVVATPEKLEFAVRLDAGIIDDVGLIVLDEGHMIGVGEREVRYEMLVQRLLRRADAPNRRLVCLSAMFGEGAGFEDFTAWIRSDEPGEPIRVPWRPTRQRPGVIEWLVNGARLEFKVESERPFVPKFVRAVAARRPRRVQFPRDAQELLIGATSEFLIRGHNVLIYCPLRKSVEATASAFAEASEGGYFLPQVPSGFSASIEDAVRVGDEWLGPAHPALACLKLGVAVHHGALPRQFLHQIERLLRERVLRVCVASPTLAQGLDLCFSVLLFRSLFRSGEIIPPSEFANVVGRVGRAFVDLDGLYLLPVHERTLRKRRKRVAEFWDLVAKAGERELESGVLQLVREIVEILEARLGIRDDSLREYVLNVQSDWVIDPGADDDDLPATLRARLNELDVALLGAVDSVEASSEDLASVLDQCLQSSLWRRHLEGKATSLAGTQDAVLKGRAKWIWNRSDAATRTRYFAAGIGFIAGGQLDEHAPALNALFQSADLALAIGTVEEFAAAVVSIAEILFSIEPFAPANQVKDRSAVIQGWVRGTALGEFARADEVRFVQDDIVYRLVWAVEAARLVIAQINPLAEVAGGAIAACLTYGVPNLTSAVFMQAGVDSRVFAVKLASAVTVPINDLSDLRMWMFEILMAGPPGLKWGVESDQRHWDRFVRRFNDSHSTDWGDIDVSLDVAWRLRPPPEGSTVRVVLADGTGSVSIQSLWFQVLGDARSLEVMKPGEYFGTVVGTSVYVKYFGERAMPSYLSAYTL